MNSCTLDSYDLPSSFSSSFSSAIVGSLESVFVTITVVITIPAKTTKNTTVRKARPMSSLSYLAASLLNILIAVSA